MTSSSRDGAHASPQTLPVALAAASNGVAQNGAGRVNGGAPPTARIHGLDPIETLGALLADPLVGVFTCDASGATEFVNDRWCALTGLSPEQARGNGWLGALHPDDAERVVEGWSAAAALGKGSVAEYRVVHADGTTVWIAGSATPVVSRGQVTGWVGICFDISAHREAEAALSIESERYGRLFEQATDVVFSIALDGRITSVNPAASRASGYSREELLQMNVFELVAPEDQSRAAEALARRIAGGEEEVLEFALLTKNGERLVLEVAGSLLEEHGELVGVLSIARDTTERRALEVELTHQAFHDSLTGLPNRRLFHERLSQALLRAPRGPGRVAVLMLDLDNFKLVNDSFGHVMGDELLRELAARLEESLRVGDTVARIGGDEFAFLLEGLEGATAVDHVVGRILDVFADGVPVRDGVQRVAASVGIALASPTDTAETLLRNADTALYRAKTGGRGGYELFDDQMRARVVREQRVLDELADAIDAHELSLWYQPIVAVADGQLIGLEALVRWPHPQWGWVQPGEFIPLAEETGLIVQISRCVLERASRHAADWRRRFPDRMSRGIAVNLSARELSDPGFLDFFQEMVRAGGGVPSDITVEVTERVFLDTADDVLAENLRRLRELGAGLSLDDFGTGYSALASLKRFPFTSLKIDRVFIRSIDEQAEHEPLVVAIVNLAHALGIEVVAEGVETEVQAQFLRELGCETAQGYFYGRPMPPEEIEALLGGLAA